MIKTTFFGIAAALLLVAAPVSAKVEVGQPAPDFTGTDTKGVNHNLSDFADKTVVLEWTNHECPYVVKHYSVGNMQKLQEAAVADGVVWLTIASSAPGKQGFTQADAANAVMEKVGAKSTARILDADGSIGKLYGAKTTPHMFVIDKGTLVYAGAIDDDSSFRSEAIAGSKNYIQAALASIKADEPIEVASTKPYGCSVKY